MRLKKYIEFTETQKFPINKTNQEKEFVGGVKYKIKSETAFSYILTNNIEVDKSQEDITYTVGDIKDQWR